MLEGEAGIVRVKAGSGTLELKLGDITREEAEAIGNAANAELAGGGGVDGAIHRAGGPAIMDELKARYKGCPTGSAVLTGAGNLKAKYVLHAVGPRYRGSPDDARLLAGAYRTCLDLCVKNGVRSVALPSISTGIYGYPVDDAALVAVCAVRLHMKANKLPELVRFVLFDEKTFAAYDRALDQAGIRE
jgi:O-acetyl-ADP-ribose deacetylase (regulator of RNase III)